MKRDIFFVREQNSTNVRVFNLKKFFLRESLALGHRVFPHNIEKRLSELMFNPKRYRPKEKEEKIFEKAEKAKVYIKSLDLFIQSYRFSSSPKKALVLHGWASSAKQMAPMIQELVDAGFEVISFDWPGHGESEGNNTSYFDFIKASDEIATHFSNIETIIGHSLGAATSIYLSSLIDRKIKLVLLAPHYNVKENLFSWTKQAGIPARITKTIFEKRLVDYKLDYDSISPANIIPKLKHDIFVIHDENDIWVSFENALKVVNDHAGTKLLKTTNLGHNRILKDKTVINEITSFINHNGGNE